MAQDSIKLYLNLPFTYLIPSDLVRNDSLYRQTLIQYLNYYHNYPLLKGIGLFRYGLIHNSEFRNHLAPYAKSLGAQYPYSIYYTTAQNNPPPEFSGIHWALYHYQGRSIPSWNNYKGVIFDGNLFAHPFDELGKVLASTNAFKDNFLIFQDDWLLSAIANREAFSRYLKTATRDSVVIYPFDSNNAETSTTNHNYLVLCLIIIWLIFALHYSIHPVYRRNLFRYFFAHTFFIRDIREWRIRIPDSGYILFAQHTLIGGTWMYALARRYFCPLGAEAMTVHYPSLSGIKLWPITFMVAGFLFSLIYQTLSVTWLSLFNKKIKHIGQALLLYAWPLQINLLGLSILIPLIIADASDIYIFLLTGFFALYWISSFYIAAFDLSSNTPDLKKRYLMLTTLPYTLTGIIAISYTLFHTKVPEILRLVALISH